MIDLTTRALYGIDDKTDFDEDTEFTHVAMIDARIVSHHHEGAIQIGALLPA